MYINRALNSVTRLPSYPMKYIQELSFTAGVDQSLICLDSSKGYYQIRMRNDSKYLTVSLHTHSSVYQWKLPIFGLAGTSGTFQRTMTEVLWAYSLCSQAYVIIMVFSKTWDGT